MTAAGAVPAAKQVTLFESDSGEPLAAHELRQKLDEAEDVALDFGEACLSVVFEDGRPLAGVRLETETLDDGETLATLVLVPAS